MYELIQKYRLAAALSVFLSVGGCAGSEAPRIAVHFPNVDETLDLSGPAAYIFGNVQPPAASLTINDRPVELHANGAFLAYLPVAPGAFVFRLEAEHDDRTTVTEVPVTIRTRSASAEAQLSPWSLRPRDDVELPPGDLLEVRAQGLAGLSGHLHITDLTRTVPLTETAPGVYEARYRIRPQDRAHRAELRLEVAGPGLRGSVPLPGRLTVRRGRPQVAVVEAGEAFGQMHGSTDGGSTQFLPPGAKLLVVGRIGDTVRVELAPNRYRWIAASALQIQSDAARPEATLRSVQVTREPRASIVRLDVSDRVPFTVEHTGEQFRLTLYYTDAGRRTPCATQDPRISGIRCLEGVDARTWRVELALPADIPLWGYDARYGSDRLEVELRWPPPVPGGEPPLSGAVIVLDPGHSAGEAGRIGPMGVPERVHNLRIARRLEALLASAGARVLLTRATDDDRVSLARRVEMAWEARADAFISLHNNALPPDADPFSQPRGFRIFYTSLYSLPLARAIHRAYQERVPLRDDGVRYGSYYVTRTTRMPAVLVESAFFMYPEQEAMLLEGDFQERLATALFEGIRAAFQSARPQAPDRSIGRLIHRP